LGAPLQQGKTSDGEFLNDFFQWGVHEKYGPSISIGSLILVLAICSEKNWGSKLLDGAAKKVTLRMQWELYCKFVGCTSNHSR
jgi:hypothetical protein